MAAQIFGSVVLGLVVVAICVAIIVYVLRWLYRRATKDAAFVRTGFSGEKVVINGGAFIIPVLHEVTPVDMRIARIEVKRCNEDALITSDRIRVDVIADFFVRVGSAPEMVSAAARSFGRRMQDQAGLRDLVQGRFIGALRTVAAQMSLVEMHERRDEYSRKVRELAAEALHAQGLELETVAVVDLDQARLEFFDPSNSFDAEGLTRVTEAIETRRRMRNEIEQRTVVEIRTQNLETQRRVLEIDRETEYARLEQEREVEIRRAAQRAELARARAVGDQEAENAQVNAQESIESVRLLQERNIAEKRVLTEEARAKAAEAEEQTSTAREKAIAERRRATDLIAAARDAEILKIQSEARATADKIDAAAASHRYDVDAVGRRQLNEADNTLSEEARAGRLRDKLLDRIEGIVRESVKPMEKIDGIRILHVDGIAGGHDGKRSVTDEVIDSALRYRVQAPLIDNLMKDLGVEGGSIGKMTDVLRDAKDIASLSKGEKSDPDKGN
jgi:uncharacterized membrane protein YqiK